MEKISKEKIEKIRKIKTFRDIANLVENNLTQKKTREGYSEEIKWDMYLERGESSPQRGVHITELERGEFFLSKNNKYLAHVKGREISSIKGFQIEEAYSKFRGEYRNLLFKILNELNRFNFIISDQELSKDAESFWRKMTKDYPKQIVFFKDNDKYEPIYCQKCDKKKIITYLEDYRYLVGIRK